MTGTGKRYSALVPGLSQSVPLPSERWSFMGQMAVSTEEVDGPRRAVR